VDTQAALLVRQPQTTVCRDDPVMRKKSKTKTKDQRRKKYKIERERNLEKNKITQEME